MLFAAKAEMTTKEPIQFHDLRLFSHHFVKGPYHVKHLPHLLLQQGQSGALGLKDLAKIRI